MELICILILIILGIILFEYWQPSIDIILRGDTYIVLLWYNRHHESYYKREIHRNWIKLFSYKKDE